MGPIVEIDAPVDSGPLAADLPSALRAGDIDVAVHIGFDGTTLSPTSIGSALVGWDELGGLVELGAVDLPDCTLGVGISGWYARPLVHGFARRPNVRVGDGDVGFSVWSSGVLVRGSVHLASSGLDWPASIDPYLAVDLGPAVAGYAIGYVDDPASLTEVGELGLRTQLVAGARFLGDGGWLGGIELGYGGAFALNAAPHVLISRSGTDRTAVWARSGADRMPRGFTWTLSAGHRF